MDLEKDLAQQIWELILEHPFYGFFSAELIKDFVPKDHEIKTACVTGHKGSCNIQMLFNEDFWSKLNSKEKKFIIKHEICHVMFEHIYGSWEWLVANERMLGNVAMDQK